MIRKAFIMQINEGAEAEYERRHNPIWKDLEAILKRHGVHNYSIFLHVQTRQLFAYVEVEDPTRWEAIALTPECRRWWRYMSDLMSCNLDGSPRSMDLTEVFHLA